MLRRVLPIVCVALGGSAFWACSDDASSTGSGGGTTGTDTGTAQGGAGQGGAAQGGAGQGGSSTTYSSGVGPAPTEEAPCGGQIYECGDLLDNDEDGLLDYQDPECLGPCDNSEDSLSIGIPGGDADACRADCYFDTNGGPGNDECIWAHWCDPNEEDPNYYPEPNLGDTCAYDPDQTIQAPGGQQTCEFAYENQSEQCNSYCGPLTPNGCDCFGCCNLPAGGDNWVWLGSLGANGDTECQLADVENPELCHPCLPVEGCLNGCGPCELCLGKTEVDPSCLPGEGGGGAGGAPPGEQCPEGVQPCGLAGQDPCSGGAACITGCCITVPE